MRGLWVLALWTGAFALAASVSAQPAPAQGPTGPSESSFWDNIFIAPGVSYRSDSVTIVEGSDRALFSTAPGEEFESVHLLFTQPADTPSPYYLEFRSYRLTRQKIIRRADEGEESSVPTGKDLGTEIHGFYAMGGREFTLQFARGDTAVDGVGIGLGAGLVSVEGDVRFARNLRESKLEEPRLVKSGILPGASFDLFVERAYLGAGYGLPRLLHAARIRLGAGLVFFTDFKNQLTAEFLQLILTVHFAL